MLNRNEMEILRDIARRTNVEHGTVVIKLIIKDGLNVETHIEADHRITSKKIDSILSKN